MIKGGYILQPRKIDDSEISNSPPHVREIWMYLIRKANHSENKHLKRGQLFTSYSQIIKDLTWFVGYRKETYKKYHCEIAMKVLTRASMITTTKTTRGLIVTICNYDYYQDPKNYENDTKATTKDTRKRQSNDTINKNDKNDKNEKEFNMFWNYFHEITGKKKTDKEPTLKYWNKLSDSEKQKALDNIKSYFTSLSDIKYCKKARTYLSDKNFNDEFKVNGSQSYKPTYNDRI
jgi:hypothetical protein